MGPLLIGRDGVVLATFVGCEISTKIPVAKKGGGYIYHSDHSVPDNVSFGQYKRVMELVTEYGAFA